jgi:hypothetical protein
MEQMISSNMAVHLALGAIGLYGRNLVATRSPARRATFYWSFLRLIQSPQNVRLKEPSVR